MRMGVLSMMVALAALVPWPVQGEQQQPELERPNLILVYTDDQRADAWGAGGNPVIRTPNLDRLAARGVRFPHAYAVLSLCSPSRAAALTGRYGSANGVERIGDALGRGERTFAAILKDAGYRTGYVGKWHLGNTPESCGFDFVCQFRANGRYFNRPIQDNGRRVEPGEHVDAYCVGRSIAFLEESARSDRPFVLFHATQAPHMDHRYEWPSRPETRALHDLDRMPVPANWQDDLVGKPPYLEKVRNRTQAATYGYDDAAAIRAHARDYYAAITEMDEHLGRLFDAIGRLGLWENTYLIFMSDNGWMLGDHGMTSKVLPYEPSIRVPLCVVGPGIEPGVDERIALNIDLAPTVLDLAGLPVPEAMHGRSLRPLLFDDESTTWRDVFVYEVLKGYGGTKPLLAAVTGRWTLAQTYDAWPPGHRPAFVELYDRQADPDELHNLADDPNAAGVRQRLEAAIAEHVERLSDQGP